MGTMLEVECRECGSISGTIDGALMAGPIARCDTCGRMAVITLRELDELVATDPALERLPPPLFRGEVGQRPLRPCECGGTLRFDAPIRCDVCHSTAVTTRSEGIAD